MGKYKIPDFYDMNALRDNLISVIKIRQLSVHSIAREMDLNALTVVRFLSGKTVSLRSSIKIANYIGKVLQ